MLFERRFQILACGLLFTFLTLGCIASWAQTTPPPPHAKPIHLKHILVIGQTKGFEHDSISVAMAAVFNMGKESGLWDTDDAH